jgi:predicted S18 family serine protease
MYGKNKWGKMKVKSLFMILLPLLLFSGTLTFSQIVIGSAAIHAPAVDLSQNIGTLTNISVVVTKGNGTVKIIGPLNVANDTEQSALSAASYASRYLGLSLYNYNFTYDIHDISGNVSGPSAGAAMTIIGISALSHRSILQNFTMTGTIDNGSIGEIGGVYDKASAAEKDGMGFVMIPAVPAGSQEAELYYLVQSRFGIPLVQVANISDALPYAYGTANPEGHMTNFTFYTNFSTATLPYANLTCSNQCYYGLFPGLVNSTFGITQNEINSLTITGFSNARQQMQAVLNQSREIAAKGYLYTAADQSFLDYINAFYFANSGASVYGGLSILNQINQTCSSLKQPQITSQNYEWLLQGELRQLWGSYTASATIGIYNTSSFDSDQVLESLYEGAEANAWCSAANFIYANVNTTGVGVTQSAALKSVAAARISRATAYGSNIYLTTAEQAYSEGNYALAMLDSEYSYSEGYANSYFGMNTSALDGMATSLATNSSSLFGAWPAQFENEAMFYVHQSNIAKNSTTAHGYAYQAYSTALLGSQIANDTLVISQNLVPSNATKGTTSAPAKGYRNVYALLSAILIILIILLIINIIALSYLSKIVKLHNKGGMRGRQRKRARGR